MKKLCLLFGLIITLFADAQKKAVTENGDEVNLFDNGTWKYVNADSSVKQKVVVNPASFTKSNNSTFLLKSTKAGVGIWLDPKKWQFKKNDNNGAAEFSINCKGNDLYGMLISERIEIPIETLRDIAIKNARKVAADLIVMNQEYRMVNGYKVLQMQMNGTVSGVKFTYYGYYYSNASGTVQLVTYTAQNLLSDQMPNIEELLNGLVALN